MLSQVPERSVILDQASMGGLAKNMYVEDHAGNRYFYDVTQVYDSFAEKRDGYSVVYFGFRTKERVPEQDNSFMEEEEPF